MFKKETQKPTDEGREAVKAAKDDVKSKAEEARERAKKKAGGESHIASLKQKTRP